MSRPYETTTVPKSVATLTARSTSNNAASIAPTASDTAKSLTSAL